MHDGWRPPYAYTPGLTARHPDDLFDPIKADPTFPDGRAFIFGLAFLRGEFYWEAHEVLEAVWLECPKNSAPQILVQALIQIANAGLKLRMNRPKAAKRLMEIAEGLWHEFAMRGDGVLRPKQLREIRDLKASMEMKYNAVNS